MLLLSFLLRSVSSFRLPRGLTRMQRKAAWVGGKDFFCCCCNLGATLGSAQEFGSVLRDHYSDQGAVYCT